MKRRQTTVRDEPAAPAEPPFGDVFEKRFRQHPVVIAASLIVSGFMAGFGARAALPDGRTSDTPLLCVVGDLEALRERRETERKEPDPIVGRTRHRPGPDCELR